MGAQKLCRQVYCLACSDSENYGFMLYLENDLEGFYYLIFFVSI